MLAACTGVERRMNQMEQFEYDGVLGGDGPALVHVVLADVLGESVDVTVVHRGSG